MSRVRPLTDAEIEALREEMRDQRGDIRTYLAIEGVDVSEWDDGRTHDADEARPDGGE